MPEVKTDVKIEQSWLNALHEEFTKPYFKALKGFLIEEKSKFEIYPAGNQIFSAFNHCPISKVKVVIIGQDPYHSCEIVNGKTVPHAHGLCFSVPSEARKIPPSLQNIYKEISRDLNVSIPTTGNLTSWAKQGVFLLNATLTVRKSEAGSHQKQGWEQFTDAVIKTLNDKCEGLVFLLWGKFAQAKAEHIDSTRHHILKTTHPSPFSAHHGFMGCGHFSTCNNLLAQMNKQPIEWAIS